MEPKELWVERGVGAVNRIGSSHQEQSPPLQGRRVCYGDTQRGINAQSEKLASEICKKTSHPKFPFIFNDRTGRI